MARLFMFSKVLLCVLTVSVFFAPVFAHAKDRLSPDLDFGPLEGKSATDSVFSDDKKGCGMRRSFLVSMLSPYKEGVSVAEAAGSVMAMPMVEKAYARFRKEGIEGALIGAMKEYGACVSKAAPHKNPSYEYDQALTHGACQKVNTVLLDTLSSIKKRHKVDTVLRKYQGRRFNLEGTSYEDMDGVPSLFIVMLYNTAGEDGKTYQDVVEQAAALSIGCS